MARHVLVPYDGSERAERGLERAVDRFPDATVTVLSVLDPMTPEGRDRSTAPIEPYPAAYGTEPTTDPSPEPRTDASTEPRTDASTEGDLVPAVERTVEDGQDGGPGVEVDLQPAVGVGQPAETILHYAEELDVDAIVIGAHDESGLRRMLFGSVAETVARHATVPVTVVE